MEKGQYSTNYIIRREYFQQGAVAFESSYTCDGGLLLGRASELGMLGDTSFTIQAMILLRRWNFDQQGDNTIVGIDDYGPGTFHWVIRHGCLVSAKSIQGKHLSRSHKGTSRQNSRSN